MPPETGMQFATREEAQKFLNFYAFVAGFSISVVSTSRTTSKKRNGEVTRVTLNLDHNHELNPGSRFFRSHIYMSTDQVSQLQQ